MKLPPDSENLYSLCKRSFPCGSRVTCSPQIMDTDDDYMVFTEDWREFITAAIRDGYSVGGSVPADELEHQKTVNCFTSLKRERDHVNIIVTDSMEFFRRFAAATSIAMRLNLRVKDDRIALFQAVLYARPCLLEFEVIE